MSAKIQLCQGNILYLTYLLVLFLTTSCLSQEIPEIAKNINISTNARVIGKGENLFVFASVISDIPLTENNSYKLEIELPQKIISTIGSNSEFQKGEVNILWSDLNNRKTGEAMGKVIHISDYGSGKYELKVNLLNKENKLIYQYKTSFTIIENLDKKLAELEKILTLSVDQTSLTATTAKYLIEMIKDAKNYPLSERLSFAKLPDKDSVEVKFGYTPGIIPPKLSQLQALVGDGVDYMAELNRAEQLTNAIKNGKDPLREATGDIHPAYRSNFDGALLPYRLYVPTNYDKSQKYPLIVLLHGAMCDESTLMDEGNVQNEAQKRGYIIVAVNGRGPLSNYRKEIGAIEDVLDVVKLVSSHYNVNSSRIYLTGHSMGASATWNIGFENRSLFAALAPLAGTRQTKTNEQRLTSAGRKIPILITCGGKDDQLPIAGCQLVASRAKELGYPVKYIEYPEADHIQVFDYSIKDIFDWFDFQTLEK